MRVISGERMRVVIFSDSHIPRRAKELPAQFLKDAEKSDLAVFLGDATSKLVIEEVRERVDIVYVIGNMDHFDGPEIRTVEIGGKRIGLLHGHQFGRGDYSSIQAFAKQHNWDAVFTGHTHRFFFNGYVLNPGSVTGAYSVMADGIPSYVLLEDGEIIRVTPNGEQSIGSLY